MKITKLKSGYYSCKVYLGKENGKEVYKRIKAPTETELRRLVKKVKASYVLDIEQSQPAGLTLYNAINKFIEARSNVLSPTTLRAYGSIRDNSFKGIINKPLDSITQEDIQAEINKEALSSSPKTIKNKIALFTSVYTKYAKKPKKLALNVPQKKKKDVYIPTRQDVDAILKFIDDNAEYEQFRIPVMLGAFLGLRRGEIGALTWEDVNLKAGTISITKAVVKTSDNTYALKAPKTYASYRVLNIPPIVLSVLKRQKRAKKSLIELSIDRISDGFRVIIKHYGGAKFRFHDLRHFYASTLLALNVPDLYAIKLTGHSTTTMLKTVYQHTFKQEEDRYKKLIDNTFT